MAADSPNWAEVTLAAAVDAADPQAGAGWQAYLQVSEGLGNITVWEEYGHNEVSFDAFGVQDPALSPWWQVAESSPLSTLVWVEGLQPGTAVLDLVLEHDDGRSLLDQVRLTSVGIAVDIDTDSNDDGWIDPDNSPTGTDDPYELEAPRELVTVHRPGTGSFFGPFRPEKGACPLTRLRGQSRFRGHAADARRELGTSP